MDHEAGKTAARLTLLTVVISAIVGLGSAFLAYQSTQRAQDRAARDTRFQADLIELRSVLDASLTDLSVTRAGAQNKAAAWEASLEDGDADSVQRAQNTLDDSLVRTRSNASRLRIRLGQEGVYNLYWFAYREYQQVGDCANTDSDTEYDEEDHKEAVRFLLRMGAWLGDWFSDLAFASAQSALRGSLAVGPTEERIAEAKRVSEQSSDALYRCNEALRDADDGSLPANPGEYWNSLPTPSEDTEHDA